MERRSVIYRKAPRKNLRGAGQAMAERQGFLSGVFSRTAESGHLAPISCKSKKLARLSASREFPRSPSKMT